MAITRADVERIVDEARSWILDDEAHGDFFAAVVAARDDELGKCRVIQVGRGGSIETACRALASLVGSTLWGIVGGAGSNRGERANAALNAFELLLKRDFESRESKEAAKKDIH